MSSILCKVNDSWVPTSKYYKKQNGEWVEISYQVFENYVETLSPFIYQGHTQSETGPVVVDETYDPSNPPAPNSDVIYTNTPGSPEVKTSSSGEVIEYTFTDTSGNTTSDVDTGIIAFDSNNPGWTLHLVVEMTPNTNNNKNIIEAYNTTNRRGLYIYTSDNYLYKKIQTANYSTNSSYVAWSRLSPTGKDSNYYKTLNTITFDITYTNDKKLSLYVNNVAHFENFDVDDTTFQNLTIKVGVGMSGFNIKEFTVVRTNVNT